MVKQTDWNLAQLFKGDNDPNILKERKIIEKECKKFVSKWKNRSDYLTDTDVLKEALDDYENWNRYYDGGGKESYYFMLRFEQNQIDSKIRSKLTQAQDFKHSIDNEMRFFYLSLAKTTPENQSKFLSSKKLEKYRHYLERIFDEAKHFLSEEGEKILSLKSTPAYGNWVKMISTFLSKEERQVLMEDGTRKIKSFSDILSLSESTNKKVRDVAAQQINEIFGKYADTATEEINSVLENKKIDDKLRKFQEPDSSRHLHDDIDTEIVDTIIEAVSSRFQIAHRFYELKAKLFKVKTLKYYERNVPYGNANKDYPYDEAVKLISIVFQSLDPEFANIFKGFVDGGQIDAYPRKGKRSGAFCMHYLISQPTYILLNYAYKLDDVLTVAHELGHGLNNELMKKKQHALSFGTSLATAEVASTFMEDFVLDEAAKEADDELRLGIFMMKLNSDIASIFRQVACYKFERELHTEYRKKGYLSKQEIGIIFKKHMSSYMGPSVEQSEGSENWWVYWIHIRYFFYVYSYASGLLISKTMQGMVKKNHSSLLKIKDFLSAGVSDSPKNIFLNLGIDITRPSFWKVGLTEIENLLNRTYELAKKLGKIS